MNRCIPTSQQLAFLDWEFGAFFHFGIRSFFLGHRDWDNKPMPADAFNPESLDCNQWISTVKAAGAKYAILVCKHHDGFANWPSRFSSYGVAQSPWRNGQGDVVREFVDACRRYHMKVGLYYSPAQWGGTVRFEDDRAYDDYFINQITELLTNYGKIDYLWFDGCGSENHTYDRARIVTAIRTLQPDILLFELWDPDTRWVGNEDGYASLDNPNVRHSLDFSMNANEQSLLAESRFLPAECDCMLRSTWFDCEQNEDTIKTTDELLGMYEMSVGRGANLLLNIGPNRHGLLNDADVHRVTEFGEALRARYGHPIEAFGDMQQESADVWSIQLPDFHAERDMPSGCVAVNRLIIEEDLTEGEAVREFEVCASLPGYTAKEICLYRGRTIGHKTICVFPTMRTGRLAVRVLQSDGICRLKCIRAYHS